jgi:hypothetical protein
LYGAWAWEDFIRSIQEEVSLMADKKSDQITIPEDLSTLSDEDLSTLHDSAVTAFQAMYPEDGSAPSDEALEALAALAEGIDAVKGEVSKRDAAALSRSSKAKELADKVLSAGEVAEEVKAESDEDDESSEDAEADASAEDEVPAELVAGADKPARRAPININLAGLKSDRPAPEDVPVNSGPKKVGFAAQGAAGFDVGTPVTIRDMAQAINSRLGGFNASAYEMAAGRGDHQSERFTIAKMRREFPESQVVTTEDPTDAMKAAVNEKGLPGGSLVASGGWCAPSETLYDLVDISEAANLISIPEIQVNRGGIRFTLGPNYAAVYASTGFAYTEAQDIAGNYNGAGGGTKPCFKVPCPGFTDVRLGYAGVCISAGLLQQRGYPEVIEDYISKTLTAHAHRVSAAVINSMVSQSTAVALANNQAGSTAPILSAVDLQAQHLRASNRMSDNATLEVVLPTWTKAAIRADLARRQGVDLLDVSDARIAGWFAARNVNPQYVVDWQDIAATAASGYTAPPTSVQFLLYAAGTFVKGVSDSITLENIYDSTLLGTNDYTALFTEDPYLVAKRLWDSRVVTVPISSNGSTHAGQQIANTGVGS